MNEEEPFSPLDKLQLGITVVNALLSRQVRPLRSLLPFLGAGIYAIYYRGTEYPVYEPIAVLNQNDQWQAPIYVGKAVPIGSRKGLRSSGTGARLSIAGPLHKRLTEHAESIQQAQNLQIENFAFRYLVVDDIWIPLGESLLINRLTPIWNVLIDGFGNHAPGAGRRNQKRSEWDVLHPGRTWAERLASHTRSQAELNERVRAFLSAKDTPPVSRLPDDEEGATEEEIDWFYSAVDAFSRSPESFRSEIPVDRLHFKTAS